MIEAAGPAGDARWGASLLFAGVTSLWILFLIWQSERRARRRAGRIASPKASLPAPLPEPDELPKEDVDHIDAQEPLAVFLTGGEDQLGPHALRVWSEKYRAEFHQVLFASIGVMDYDIVDRGTDPERGFKGTEEAKRLRRKTRLDLDPYLAVAHELGMKADCRVAIDTSAADGVSRLADEITAIYPHSVFFVGKLVFERPRWFERLLFAPTGDAIRRSLERKGIPVTVIPVVLPETASTRTRRVRLVEFRPESNRRSAS